MKKIAVGFDEVFGPWVMAKFGSRWCPGESVSIGLVDVREDGTWDESCILAGILYEDFNGCNVICHIAAVPGKRWLNRPFLWYIHDYPFNQLGCKRVTVVVPQSNTPCLNLVHGLGFQPEATLKDAHPDGDLVVLKLLPENSKWLHYKESPNGKKQRTILT